MKAITMLSGLAALALGAVALSPGASGVAARTYTGAVIGDPAATVRFTVPQPTAGRTGAFRIENFEIVCEGEAPSRTRAPEIRIPFTGRDFFHGHDFDIDSLSFYTEVLTVKGYLLPHGRAKGFVFYYSDPSDPPDEPDNFSECSTDGLVRWKASRSG